MTETPDGGDWKAISVWRRAERKAILTRREALNATEYRAKCRVIEAALDALTPGLAGACVGLYWPIRKEFDPLPWARRFIAAGGGVALPVVLALGQPLEFRAWTQETPMAKGVYDIPYPAEGGPLWPTTLIVPLLGFDGARYRLGYGAGFYDRTIAAYATPPRKIGVGFELGRLATIYPQPHDIPMDAVITEAAG